MKATQKKETHSWISFYLLLDYVSIKKEALSSLSDTKVQQSIDITKHMKQELLNKYFSRPRYNRYLIATHNDADRAKRLYNANIRLAQSIHPIITQFEVVLRNSLNIQMTSHFVDNDWIINQKNGFMRHPTLKHSNFFLKRSIQKSENDLNQRGIPITSGKIISHQTLGFWLALFLPHHYSLIGGQPIHIFINKPTTENRASIYSKLDAIRNFRNRVNHCEPLCFNGNNIDCTEILEIRNQLYNLVAWIEPDLVPFFKGIDNVQGKIASLLRI
ncbi:MAG: hypothetical protein HWE21_11305 [Cytophagia bacterium]|nr:hypothetical protein [Cytophagia bacterium]